MYITEDGKSKVQWKHTEEIKHYGSVCLMIDNCAKIGNYG